MENTTSIRTPAGNVHYRTIKKIEKNVIVLLDISGSMSGSSIHNAKAAIEQLSTKIPSIDTLIVFNHTANILPFSELTTVDAGGGTCFADAFSLAIAVLTDGLNVIVLFTDGETDYSDVELSIQAVRGSISACVQVQVHAIGIGNDLTHDLLRRLAEIDIIGTVQYVGESNDGLDIPDTIKYLEESINTQSVLQFIDSVDEDTICVDISDLPSNLQAQVVTLMMQKVTKERSDDLSKRYHALYDMLQGLTLEEEDRIILRKQLRQLCDVTASRITDNLFHKTLAEIVYCPKNNKRLAELGNRAIINNRARVEEFMANKERPDIDIPAYLADECCIITQSPALECYKQYGIFGVALDYKREERYSANPESGKVTVQNVYLSWEGFEFMIDNAGQNQEKKLLKGLDGVNVTGFLPLIPNDIGLGYLEVSAALYSTGSIFGVSKNATRALPILALLDIYLRENFNEWCAKMETAILPMCKLVLPNMAQVIERFETPRGRTPDAIPSLPVFLMRCILADKIPAPELLQLMFLEAGRRRNQHGDKLKMAELWMTKIEQKDTNIMEIIKNTLAKWQNRDYTMSEVKIDGKATVIPDEPNIKQAINDLIAMWNASKMPKILKRRDIKDASYHHLQSFSTEEKIQFLGQTTLSSARTTTVSVADLGKPIIDGQNVRSEMIANILSMYWNPYCTSTDITECAAIVHNISEWGRSILRRKLRQSIFYNIPYYGVKSCLLDGGYYYRHEINDVVEFDEVWSTPLKS